MPRKKKGDAVDNGSVLELKPEDRVPENGESQNGQAETPANGHAATNGTALPEKRKPLVSWRLMSDRWTSIELAVWSNVFQGPNGEFEQLSCTVARTYKVPNGQWCKGGSWRIHDIPIMQFLLAKAHAFALDRRAITEDSRVPV